MRYTVDAWRQLGQLVSLGGHQLFVLDSADSYDSRVEGEAALLLIHGFPTSSWDWSSVWAALTQVHRVIALDLLGFGLSDKPNPHEYSMHEQADLVEALVLERGLSGFHVLAHDVGDTVAQELLARQNEGRGAGTWRSLCLLNGGLFPETHRPRPIQRLLLSPVGPLVNRLTTRRAFDRSFSAVFGPETQPTRDELDAYWILIQHNDGRLFHRLIRYMNDRIEHRARWVRALQDSVVPVGLINGSADTISGAHMVRRYRELVRADDFVVELPGIGHYPQVEAPDFVVRAHRRFVASLSP